MKKIILLSLLLGCKVFANVGTALIVKGPVFKGDFPIQKGEEIKEGDTVFTKSGGFARFQMNDKTIINLGPDSGFLVKTYKRVNKKRNNFIKLLKGKFRILVKEFAMEGEKLQFDTHQVSLGVRGTEFLSNAYSVGGAPSTDTLLIKGSLKVSGTGFNSFTMEPGQYFNSQDLLRSGMRALKKATPEVLDALKENAEELLPSLQTAAGFVTPAFGLASLITPNFGSSKESNKKEVKVPLKNKEENKKQKKVSKNLTKKKEKQSQPKGHSDFKYNLKEEPRDIRDAVLNREKNKKDNKCWFFFYKTLPGAGEPERFRRERDCDEFEFDL
jgi:hypothetical protein